MKALSDKQLRDIGKIIFIASDKRGHVLMDDQIEWLEEKMAEIKRLSKKLPNIKYEVKK